METETNAMTFPTLNNFMIFPLYLNVVTISKDFNLIFNTFSKLPYKSVLSRPSILPFFNGENPFLVHGFHTKNGIPEKEQSYQDLSNCKLKFLTTTLPLRAYLCTFVVFVTVIIYVQNGFSVGNYSLKCSHF